MRERTYTTSRILLGAVALILAGCATARMYPQEQISAMTRGCGLALGEVFQDEMEPRLLFLMTPEPTRGQLRCVGRWARKHHLRLAVVEALVAAEPE